ncbi:MAG: ribonuclease PH [Holosporales bacterium]|jgi:ribonuclease PH|nr:ribonuclease PH [Holosporales bacterium]
MKRNRGRGPCELRQVFLGPGFVKNAKGSCFVKFGDTHVICAASFDEKVPPFLKNSGAGWVTAEYGMLPCSSSERIEREAAKGKQSGRTMEIQRFISRSLRAAVDLRLLGERQIRIDCDVLQADGGTRTASITGGFVAMHYAIQVLLKTGKIKENPIVGNIAAISCGVCNGEELLDLDYQEDSTAEVDANFVMNDKFDIIEIQMTAERKPFSVPTLNKLTEFAQQGIETLIKMQKDVVERIA